MPRFIAFLRAINVGAGRTIKMSPVRQVFERLGFSGVRTFLASGNIIFETRAKNTKSLESKIEKKLRETLAYEVATFVRTDRELAKIANYNPFRRATIKAAESNVIFLKDRLDKKSRQKLLSLSTNTDQFDVHGREIYWLRHKKEGGSTFSTVPFDRALDHPFTIRSAKTITRLTIKL